MSDLREIFFEECEELLESMAEGLSELENDTGDKETIHAMFRSVHSMKGGAGAFGLDRLVSFAHSFENVLDDIRSDKTQLDESVLNVCLASSDHLCELVEAERNGNSDELPATAELLENLRKLDKSVSESSSSSDEAQKDVEIAFEPVATAIFDIADINDSDESDEPLSTQSVGGRFEIKFSATRGLYEAGHDPALLFRALAELGDLTVESDESYINADAYRIDAEPLLSWKLILESSEILTLECINEVFEFVDGLSELTIQETECDAMESSQDKTDAPEEDTIVDEIDEVAKAATADIIGSDKKTPVSDPSSTTIKQSKKAAPTGNATIRVDLDRVDRLINLVGELVISESMLRQSMSEADIGNRNAVDDAMSQLRQLSGMLQESVMAIRAQPVRGLFQRMARIVREASKEAGKPSKIVMLGEATEIDKTVIERLVEPLTHMIRNSVDHGIEDVEKRIASGKSRTGLITLEAAHRSGRVVISLEDDGGGINRKRVREIAEQKGLIKSEDELSDADIDNLLFAAGFSTASEVSNLSGRGVGMDVVRNKIQALGGRVSIQSTEGLGTKLTISLPLTLAVMEGMVVIVGEEALVVPTLALRETLQPGQTKIHEFCEGDRSILVNDQLVPIMDLGAALGYRAPLSDIDNQTLLLVEGEAGQRAAITVDQIVDQREVVIKGLEQNYEGITGVSAATILGDGKIALIVDTDQMVSTYSPIPTATITAIIPMEQQNE